MHKFTILILSLLLTACTGSPKGVQAVTDLDNNRYLGQWYEIARLDHSFERGLDNVTASYSLKKDGGINIVNKGFDTKEKKWKTASGKAYFVNDDNVGHLKVSFFGPFYSSYIIFELDKQHYQYAFISGYNHSYLWLLSRTPDVDQKLLQRFVKTAAALGFNVDDLILVKQDKQQ